MNLQHRFLLVTGTATLLVAVVLYVSGQLAERRADERYGAVSVKSVHMVWDAAVSGRIDQMEANMVAVTRDALSLRALQRGNRDALAESIVTTYNRLSTMRVLTALEVVDAAGEVVFSAPHTMSGRGRGAALRRALQEGTIVRGIDTDHEGSLMVVVASPLYAQTGRPIGAVLFAKDLASAVTEVGQRMGATAFIIGRQGGIAYATDQALAVQIAKSTGHVPAAHNAHVALGERSYDVVSHAIEDHLGRHVADIVSATDHTAEYRKLVVAKIWSNIVTLLVVLLSLGGVYLYVVRESTRINAGQRQRIAELSRLNDEKERVNRQLEDAHERLSSEIVERRQAEAALRAEKEEQKALIIKLQEAHDQLLQSEKMASIGQLAAGVAHEINNPVGYISSNLGTLQGYVQDTFKLIDAYEALRPKLAAAGEAVQAIQAVKEDLDLDYLRQDMVELLQESQEGVQRVRQIVKDLKEFSHVDDGEWQWADVREGLDSTLNIVYNELKYKAEVVKDYGDIPQIECLMSQLNQVFMNLLVNAAHAIEERGVVTIRTGAEADWVWVEIADTGKGIAPEQMNRIFEPFFTTKPVGKGTGLGLSLSYGIVQKHGGRIDVESEVGKGTAFRVWLPIRQSEQRAQATA